MNALIFAGGSGSRLWPASTKNKPKQILSFFGEETMLEKTYNRIEKGIPSKKIFVATAESYKQPVTKQLSKIPAKNFLFEPVRKNRGPAIGVMMLYLQAYSKDPYFTTVWSDDHINQEDIYHYNLQLIEKYLTKNPNEILAIGVYPSYPNTSFRYVETGKIISSDTIPIFNVKKFHDKPHLAKAKKMYSSGKHFWNSGYFISSTDAILDLYKKHFKECYKILEELKPYIGTSKQNAMVKKLYPKMPSFDFEEIFYVNPSLLKLVPANFDWMDIGRWGAVKDVQSEQHDNIEKGLVVTHGTEASLIYNYTKKQLVSTLHVNNLVIVVTPDAVLVADKDKTEDLKMIIEKIDADVNLKKYL
jgi:mannose-1-phosphate guanylyltransferase